MNDSTSMIIQLQHWIEWIGVLTSLYGAYFISLALIGEVKKKTKTKTMPPVTRFALVIAARNEADVIENLVLSLQQQNYPADLYDIFVAPNNCTDNTRELAVSCGAQIFDPVGEIRSKGDVLSQFVKRCLNEKKYDAICVFDADNIVHSDFLQKMNNAKLSGAHIAQGFKDSKNPTDSDIASSFSIYFWIIDRFYNASREALKLSSFITGTGFMVTTAFLERIGGWNTRTITEDYEFSAQCVLAGERVHYVSDAIVYDEQPLTFEQSWKQRRRWSTGNFDSSKYYLRDLLSQAVHKRSAACFDLAMTYLSPVIFILSLAALLGQAVLMGCKFFMPSFTDQPQFLSFGLFLGLVLCSILAVFVTYTSNRKTIRGLCRAISFFMLFLLSWLPINVVSLLKKQRKWEAIAHTRALTLEDL
ncbi:glycosyltransferase family 2 protein [Paenibacillus sp. S150]|uniref:glycosyltransferase family 2 protein n=1 Tax=Paenibacillus sp. S150 TaxID=2749826 RepID=UPI001C5737AD|nr:glycosyltransferase family 2 protein [Paenibacillus sp. S150]MBW4080599.1 glycosyltransferase [Paenibacillus sp. S150]